jgi:PAS domain-containing protein
MPQRPVELILARHLAISLSVPVLLIDSKGDTLYFNEAAEELVGRRFDEIDALPFEERTALLAPSDRQGRSMRPELMPGMVAMREGRPVHAELSITTPDRGLRPIEATAVPLQGVDDIVVGAWVVIWLTEGPHMAPVAPGAH